MAGPKPFGQIPGISKDTLSVLEAQGFTRATPVQEATIPLFAGNKDVAVDACTGSGKTLAFVVPVIEKLRKLEHKLKINQVGAIIVSPTRELARQIHSVAAPFVASVPWMASMLLVGGTDPALDVAAFRESGGHLLVGTPGRLDDVLKRVQGIDFKAFEVLVLDEADRLLDMGFQQQLDAIMARLPKQRRTGLFSATQTEAVQALTRAGLRNPVRVNVAVSALPAAGPAAGASSSGRPGGAGDGGADAGGEPGVRGVGPEAQKTPSSLSLEFIACEVEDKFPQLVSFLAAHSQEKVIVYFLTCMCVEYYHLMLARLSQTRSLPIYALHGRMKQAAREATLSTFAQGAGGVLLATDVAARGLDIADVGWVVQYDAPQDPAAFVHRVGRTARMGASGAALALLAPHEASYVELLRLRGVPLQRRGRLPPPPPPHVAPGHAASGGAAAAGTNGGGGNGGGSGGGSGGGGGGGGGGAVDGSRAVLAALRRESETDREAMEKGTRAFVSYVRGYKEHHCKFIFRLQDLHVGQLAASMGLLRLPRMTELRKTRGADEFEASGVEPSSVRFRDKAREKQRQQLIRQRAQEEVATAAGSNGEVQGVASKVGGKRPAEVEAAVKKLPAAKRRQQQSRDDLEDLSKDYSLLRKLKKGKISQHEFEVATGMTSSDEDDEGEPRRGAGGRSGGSSGGQRAAAGAAKRAEGKRRKRGGMQKHRPAPAAKRRAKR